MGALEQPTVVMDNTPPPDLSQQVNLTPVPTDEPVLFRSSVQRSATFEGSPPAQNKIHRSETVPAATITSSLAGLGSSLKIGFRYA